MAKRTDVFTKAKRSEVMSKIRGKGTEAVQFILSGSMEVTCAIAPTRHGACSRARTA